MVVAEWRDKISTDNVDGYWSQIASEAHLCMFRNFCFRKYYALNSYKTEFHLFMLYKVYMFLNLLS